MHCSLFLHISTIRALLRSAAPTEIRKHRRTIARCQTILAQRGVLAPAAEAEAIMGEVGRSFFASTGDVG